MEDVRDERADDPYLQVPSRQESLVARLKRFVPAPTPAAPAAKKKVPEFPPKKFWYEPPVKETTRAN